jgi:hypothetical protein
MAFASPPRAVLNLIFAGFTVRYLGLGRFSLWLDEGATWSWVIKPTWAETALQEANHPPLWWLITRAWVGLFGDSEEMLRLPAAICGVVTIYLAWLLARRLLVPAYAPARGGFPRAPDGKDGERIAVWFTGFIAASSFLIEISQEARMYALLVAESLGLVLLYLRWLDTGRRGTLVAYGVLASLSLYTQYFAIWPILALCAHAAWLWLRTRRAAPAERVPLAPLVLVHALVALSFVPWIFHLVTHYTGLHRQSYNALEHIAVFLWRVGVGPGIAFVDAERAGAPLERYMETEGTMLLLTALAWLPFLGLGAFALAKRPGLRSLASCALLVPLLGVIALLPWFTLVHERYLVFLAPWLWLLAVLGVFQLGPRLRWLGLGCLMAVSAVSLAAYHGCTSDMERVPGGPMIGGFPTPKEVVVRQDDPARFLHHGTPFGKEPWREAAQLVHDYAADGDLVLLHPGYVSLVWDYYGRARKGGALAKESIAGDVPSEEELLRQLEPVVKGRKRVFLVISHAPTLTPRQVYERLFKVIGALWYREGAKGMESAPPIPLKRSWGVHVAIFNRT